MQRDQERLYRTKILTILAEGRIAATLGGQTFQKLWREEEIGIPDGEYYELIWKLIQEGLVYLTPRFNNNKHLTDFAITLSTRGREYVDSEGEYEPDDPDGYLDLLRERIPDIDDLVFKYLQEALSTYRGDCLMATAVMLGCASERAVLLLGEAYIASQTQGVSQKFTDSFRSEKVKFGEKLRALRNQLEPITNEFPRRVQQQFSATLESMAGLIRHTRNEAGHPSGVELSRDQMRMNLHTAAYYVEIVYELISYFRSSVVSAQQTS